MDFDRPEVGRPFRSRVRSAEWQACSSRVYPCAADAGREDRSRRLAIHLVALQGRRSQAHPVPDIQRSWQRQPQSRFGY